MLAKRQMMKFDLTKAVLPIKSVPLRCIMVTSRSETLLFINTRQREARFVAVLNQDGVAAQVNNKVRIFTPKESQLATYLDFNSI